MKNLCLKRVLLLYSAIYVNFLCFPNIFGPEVQNCRLGLLVSKQNTKFLVIESDEREEKFQIVWARTSDFSVKFFVKKQKNLVMDPNESKEAFGNGVETATQSVNKLTMKEHTTQDGGGVQVTCFSEVSNEVTLHFQIIRLQKQVPCFLKFSMFFLSSWIYLFIDFSMSLCTAMVKVRKSPTIQWT